VHKTSELLDAMLQQENHQADFMDAFAQRLPTAVITYLMGIPEADAERIRAWNVVLNSAIPGPFYDTDAWKHFEGYILGLLAGYRMAEQAPDTIISRLFKTDLSQDEILMTIFQLLIAGADTSTMLLGNLLWELLRVPARWEIVKADRKLIIPAVEEALRLHPPLNWVMRSCPTSVTIHRETLPAGSRLVISMTSANRDEARWGATAEDFEIGRPNVANHMTFGAGRHFCLGAQLARLQVSVALEMMLEHIPTLSLAKGYQYDPLAGAMIHGPGRLDVIW
jgi:cytochrome P450